MKRRTHPYVDLGMYPFASVAWAWDDIWAAVHTRAPWTPPALTRSGDVESRWGDPACVVTQVCGWPFAARLRDDMELVGAFALAIPETGGVPAGYYRPVLLSPHDASLRELVGPDARAAVNGADSLSGWYSLLAATVGPGGEWPGSCTFTGSHLGSVRALADGGADLACIDSWSLALIGDEEPDLIAGLRRVGYGPVVPTPPVTVRRSVGPRSIRQLRSAFHEAIADAATSEARAALRISGAKRHRVDDYLTVLPLGSTR